MAGNTNLDTRDFRMIVRRIRRAITIPTQHECASSLRNYIVDNLNLVDKFNWYSIGLSPKVGNGVKKKAMYGIALHMHLEGMVALRVAPKGDPRTSTTPSAPAPLAAGDGLTGQAVATLAQSDNAQNSHILLTLTTSSHGDRSLNDLHPATRQDYTTSGILGSHASLILPSASRSDRIFTDSRPVAVTNHAASSRRQSSHDPSRAGSLDNWIMGTKRAAPTTSAQGHIAKRFRSVIPENYEEMVPTDADDDEMVPTDADDDEMRPVDANGDAPPSETTVQPTESLSHTNQVEYRKQVILNGPVKRTGNLLYIGSKDSGQLVVNTTTHHVVTSSLVRIIVGPSNPTNLSRFKALSEEIMRGASEQEKSKFKNMNGVHIYIARKWAHRYHLVDIFDRIDFLLSEYTTEL